MSKTYLDPYRGYFRGFQSFSHSHTVRRSSFISKAILAVVIGLFVFAGLFLFPQHASGQAVVQQPDDGSVIVVGDQKLFRPWPDDMTQARRQIAGLSAMMNYLMDAYLTGNTDAIAGLQEIMKQQAAAGDTIEAVASGAPLPTATKWLGVGPYLTWPAGLGAQLLLATHKDFYLSAGVGIQAGDFKYSGYVAGGWFLF